MNGSSADHGCEEATGQVASSLLLINVQGLDDRDRLGRGLDDRGRLGRDGVSGEPLSPCEHLRVSTCLGLRIEATGRARRGSRDGHTRASPAGVFTQVNVSHLTSSDPAVLDGIAGPAATSVGSAPLALLDLRRSMKKIAANAADVMSEEMTSDASGKPASVVATL